MDNFKNSIGLLILLIVISATSEKVLAQGPPIFSDSPLLLGLEGGGIRTFGKYISIESGQTYIQPLVVPYNVTTDFQIGGIQPFVVQSPDNKESKSGFGNFTLFGKYSIIQIDGKVKTVQEMLKSVIQHL